MSGVLIVLIGTLLFAGLLWLAEKIPNWEYQYKQKKGKGNGHS